MLAKTLSVGRPEAKSEACIWVNQEKGCSKPFHAALLALSRMRALRRHAQLTAPSSPGLLVGVGLWEYQLEALGQAEERDLSSSKQALSNSTHCKPRVSTSRPRVPTSRPPYRVRRSRRFPIEASTKCSDFEALSPDFKASSFNFEALIKEVFGLGKYPKVSR